MTPDDESLLAKARTLDPLALQTLHQQYYGSVARYIQLKVGNAKTVEDLTSEVFMRVIESLQRGNGWKTSPQSWIMGIARNTVADYYRRQSRTTEVELKADVIANEELGPSQQFLRNERKNILWQAIQTLTEDQRDVVILRFMAGVNIKEVAQIIGKSPGAVKALQHRALQALAENLATLEVKFRK